MKTLTAFVLSCLLVSPATSKQLHTYIQSVNSHVHWYRSVLYAEAFKKSAKEFKLSPSWLAAIAQQETAFTQSSDDGMSPASYGIMQLQVRTAKIIAKGLGDDPDVIDGTWLNANPEKSIRYSACHLRSLLNMFGQSYYWATRSYNGGDKRIKLVRKGQNKWHHLSINYYNAVFKHFNRIKEFLNDGNDQKILVGRASTRSSGLSRLAVPNVPKGSALKR